MRSPLPLGIFIAALCTSLSAQQHTKAAPFVLTGGPTWGHLLTGLQLRAEHSLMRDRRFGLRLETGARWTPTQNISAPSIVYPDYQGTAQAASFHVGVSATFNPWPRGRISPYLVAGVAAVQSWSSVRAYYRVPDGSFAQVGPAGWSTHGAFAGIWGYGLRVHLGDRPIQVEFRHDAGWRSLTLGTALRF